MSTFADMKKNRRNTMESIRTVVEKTQKDTQSYQDDRFWKPEQDKGGNGFAVVRFLAQTDGEDIPWIKYWDHGFQGPGGWFIENCLTSINQKCPLCEYNTQLWNNGPESDKDQVRKQKRRLRHVSNIYVVHDPANPQNEGKVMLYRYGKKIYDKLSEAMNPEFKDEVAFNPFDLWEGANFKLKIRKVDGWPNYDRSEFDHQNPLFENDDEIESAWKKQYKLQEFLAPEQYKSYDELKTHLTRVLGQDRNIGTADEDSYEEVVVAKSTVESPSTKFGRIEEKVEKAEKTDDKEEEPVDMDYFARLSEDTL
jgi:hypothetical protein